MNMKEDAKAVQERMLADEARAREPGYVSYDDVMRKAAGEIRDDLPYPETKVKAYQEAISEGTLETTRNPDVLIARVVEHGIWMLLQEGVLGETLTIRSWWQAPHGMVIRVMGYTE